MSRLIILCGVSASGKTTWSKNYCKQFPHVVRFSTDECRKIVSGDESNQECSYKVFESIYLMTEHLLEQGKEVLIDCCNYSKKNRKRFIAIAKRYQALVECIVVGSDLTLAELIQRNEQRERKVPINVIQRQFEGFEEPELNEGFTSIERYLKHSIAYVKAT